MLVKIKKLFKRQSGITGLETAIILIAFVVVSSVLAYTILSGGLFSSQKSQQAILSGVEQAQTTMEIKGAIIGKAEVTGNTGYLSQLTFTISNPLGGTAMDFTSPVATAAHNGLADSTSNNRLIISYFDSTQRVQDLYWTYTELNGNGNSMLEPNEKFQITVGDATHGAGGGNLVDCLSTHITKSHNFTLEIRTNTGAVLQVQRTAPAYIEPVNNLN